VTASERYQIKHQILSDIEKLEKEIQDLEELCKPIAPDCCLGDLGRFEAMHDQENSERTLHEARIRLNRLSYALGKVDREDYGLCEACEEAIPIGRLMIVPESTRCVHCAE